MKPTGWKRYCLDVRTATPHFPGVGRYASELTESLSQLVGSEEELVLLCDLESAKERRFSIGTGARCVPSSVSPFSLAQQFTIPNLLKKQKASLYHSTYYLMPYRAGVPTALTVYDLIPLRCSSSLSPKARLFFRLAHRLAVSAATRIIAISRATQDDLLAHYKIPAGRISVINLGVSAHFRPASSEAVNAVRAKHSLPANFALYVGINKPHKNLVRLVDAWRQISDRKPAGGAVLVIAGHWDRRYEEVPDMIRQAELQASVRVLGPVAPIDLPPLYSAARLFVFPSLYEGFGLPVLESMACGTPVACSDIRALREVGGDAVAYFNPLDVTRVGEVVETVLADPDRQRRLSEAGLERAAGFTWQRTAQQTLDLYRDLVG